MAKPVVFVIGASGTIGKASVTALSSGYGEKVDIRAGVRDPEKAKSLQTLTGVTVVQAEMGQTDKLKEIFRGVRALLIVCPGSSNRVEVSIKTAEAAKEVGVHNIAVISGTSAAGPDVSLFGKHFHNIESGISRLGLPFTFIRLPYFFENFFAHQVSIKEQSVFYGAVDPEKLYSLVAAEDAGAASAAILVSPEKHAGKTYSIVSNRGCYSDLARAFTDALGHEVKYVRVSYEQATATLTKMGVPQWVIDGMVQYDKLIDAGSPVVDLPNINDFFEITGHKPTDMAAWMRRFAAAFK